MRVELAGFGVGGVGVGEDGGERGVLERHGRVGMVDQCDRGNAHQGAVAAMDLLDVQTAGFKSEASDRLIGGASRTSRFSITSIEAWPWT